MGLTLVFSKIIGLGFWWMVNSEERPVNSEQWRDSLGVMARGGGEDFEETF